MTPDTLAVTGSGCFTTHLSGYQVELFGRFVRDIPDGQLVILVALAVILPSRLAGQSAIHVSPSGCHTPLQVAIGFSVGILGGVLLSA